MKLVYKANNTEIENNKAYLDELELGEINFICLKNCMNVFEYADSCMH